MEKLEKKKRILEWIKKNGYPLELKVAKSFSRAGFSVAQSIFFEDPITKKFRETDIIAHTTKLVNDVWVNLTFVVECKISLDKPWIAFNNDQATNFSSNKLPIMTTKNGHKLLNEIVKNPIFKSNLIFPNEQKLAYSVMCTFNNKKDLAYSATQSVLSAVEFLVEKSNDSHKKFLNIYFPMVAVEGDLYEARISEQNEIELEEVNELKVATIKSFAEQNSTIVTIFSSRTLEEFSRKMKEESDKFYFQYESQIDRITKENPTNRKFFAL